MDRTSTRNWPLLEECCQFLRDSEAKIQEQLPHLCRLGLHTLTVADLSPLVDALQFLDAAIHTLETRPDIDRENGERLIRVALISLQAIEATFDMIGLAWPMKRTKDLKVGDILEGVVVH